MKSNMFPDKLSHVDRSNLNGLVAMSVTGNAGRATTHWVIEHIFKVLGHMAFFASGIVMRWLGRH